MMGHTVRIFISTGEVSGDLQGALLVKSLLRQAALRNLKLDILALGGDRMVQAGATLLGNTTTIGSVGILESLPFVLPTLRLQRRVQQVLQQQSPDLVVMIDYFGGNLSIGRFMRRSLPQVPTVYYIAPQEWVWSLSPRNTQRILDISDRVLAIFPQEATYYRKWGGNVSWVGHPLIDRVQTAPSRQAARQALGIAPEDLIVALIPASRTQELHYILPIVCEAARRIQSELPQVKFWVPLAIEKFREPLQRAIDQYQLAATIVSGESQRVIAAADLAIAKSGTVNLETALLNVPQVVLYRLNPVTAWIARHLLKFSAPFVSPPNLLLMEPIVPELLQEQATPDRVAEEALSLLLNDDRRQQMQFDYQRMRKALGEPDVCDRAAAEILDLLDASGASS